MLPLLTSVHDLANALESPEGNEILIIDLCRDDLYPRFHLPGAVHVSPSEIVSGEKPAVGKLPSIERLNSLFSRIGYGPDKHIVVYDDEGGGWAGRFIWTLDVIGHQSYSFLNGGIQAWAAAELELTDTVPSVEPTDISVSIDRSVIAEKEDVLASLDNPDIMVWDARSAEEYMGTRAAAARVGHIPGAINLDWVELMDRSANLALREDIPELLKARGLSDATEIITHCQTHHRSGLTYFVGKLNNLNIRAYHGSWSEWGNDPDTPIDNPAA